MLAQFEACNGRIGRFVKHELRRVISRRNAYAGCALGTETIWNGL